MTVNGFDREALDTTMIGVYFVGLFNEMLAGRDPWFIKIGYSRNVTQRLASLQNANPFELRLLGRIPANNIDEVHRLEAALHRDYDLYHARGEWFTGNVWPHICKRYSALSSKPILRNPWDELLELSR